MLQDWRAITLQFQLGMKVAAGVRLFLVGFVEFPFRHLTWVGPQRTHSIRGDRRGTDDAELRSLMNDL
jgi:hypothetical protein